MRVALLVLSFGIFGILGAQSRYSKKPSEFIKQYKEVAYKSATELQKAQLDSFVVFWDAGGLSSNQQKNIMKTAETLASKRQRPLPTFVQMGNIARHAIDHKNISDVQMDTLTLMFADAVKNYEAKKYKFLFNTLESYTRENLLIETKTHKLYALGKKFNFSILDAVSEDYSEEDFIEEEEQETETEDAFDSWDDDGFGEESYDDVNWDDEEVEVSDEGNSDNLTAELYSSEKVVLTGPVINLKGIYLVLYTPQDTININGTQGNLSLTTGVFSGEGGNLDWSSTGLSSEVNAQFENYSFNISKPEFSADNVLMNYPGKLEGEVKGIFDYKYVSYKDKPKYPRFMSYKNDIKIQDLPNHIDYKGGFAMNGDKVFSSCASGAPSTLIVSDADTVKFKARAKYFELGDSIYASNPSYVVLYFGQDSIGHPGVRLKYNDASKELSVRKDITSFKEATFSNSYHALDMDVDQIDWVLTDSIMKMNMVGAKNEVAAFFDSELGYSETKYIHLKGYFSFHPLQMIMNYCRIKKKKEFTVEEVAKYYNKKEFTVKTAVASLNKKGFIAYNYKMGTALLTDKAFHYYKSRRGKTDYDIISVKSLKPVKDNAVMDMETYDLTVDGVDRVLLSDSNDVQFFPKERIVVFRKNRDMLFDGIVTTNNYVFNGREFEFSYDSFNLNLVHIDSIEFSVEVTDSVTGEKKKEKIDNKLTYSEGILTIDEVTNKSGLESNPRFPYFNADHGASVLFNKGDILDGAYDTSFRYQIPPFSVDSLSGDIESTVSFDGEFYSGGVFPLIDQPLEVQNDNGFGFTHQTPPEGYPIFGDKGVFTGTITLGKNGLRGDGELVYLNTTLKSMDFVFYKDSVKGLGDIANTVAGTNKDLPNDITFPECNVSDYEMAFYPSKDSMHITNYENAIEFYNDEVELNGALVISNKGMRGSGVVETHRSLTISKDILFKERSFSAQKGQFEILSDVVGKPALKSDYVNVFLDLDEQNATFSPSEEGYASNNFPYLKYRTSLNDGFWDIKKRIITMEKPSDMELSESYFYSTKKNQDSLAFNATKAYYIIDSLKLLVEGVEEIEVADAIIYPDSNKVEIKENAKMVTLKNAKISMDTLNEFHHLVGNIDINSKKDFDGNADYQYITFKQDTLPIVFSEFKLEAVEGEDGNFEYHTVCRGAIAEADTFVIAPKMIYKGDVIMYANKRLLSLDGYIKLDLENQDTPLPWLRYENSEDVDQIRVDLENQEELIEREITTGLYYSGTDFGYYSSFLNTKEDEDDQEAFISSGFLVYDLETKEFKIEDKNRIDTNSFKGNIFGFSEADNYYDFSGKLDLINSVPEIPHHYSLGFSGHGKHNYVDSTLDVTGLGALRFEMPSTILKQFGSKISLIAKYYTNTVKPSRVSDTLYERLGGLATEKELTKYVSLTESNNLNPYKSFKALSDAVVFNDIELFWNPTEKTWHTEGPLGIVSIGDYPVDCFLKGYLEIKKTPEEDQINFYLEGGPGQWYYFSYSENSLSILSSDLEMMKFVNSKNTEAKNLPKNLYYWTGGDMDDLTRFKSNYIRDYLGGEDLEIENSSVPSQGGFGGEDNDFEEIEDEFEEVEDDFEEVEDDDFEEEFEDIEEDEFEEIDEVDESIDNAEETLEEIKDTVSSEEPSVDVLENDETEEVKEELISDDVASETVSDAVEKTSKKEKKKKEKKKKSKKDKNKVEETLEVEETPVEEVEDEFEEIEEEDEFEEGN